METNGHIITGTNNRLDTRLLDGESKHVYVSIVDLHHVTVVGVPRNPLAEYFDKSPQTLEEFNKLIESIGACSPDDDIFVVSVSDTTAPLCVKLFGKNNFVVVMTENTDGVRFSIFQDVGKEFDYEYTNSANEVDA